ncbi:ABC transporter ATP-binding protein [Corynebacterium suicordis]
MSSAPDGIAVKDLSVRRGKKLALQSVSAQLTRGEGMTGIVGPNGSGKSTLISAAYGALKPQSGNVTVDGSDLRNISTKHIARTIGVVAQMAPAEIPVSVWDYVSLGRLPHQNWAGMSSSEDAEWIEKSLANVGMLDHARSSLMELSGGETQRVNIARALAQNPRYLLLDEPTNHLDVHYQHSILQLVRDLGIPSVVVLHDLNLAARYCENILLFDAGTLAHAGTAAEVLTPEKIEPIYRMKVRRIEDSGRPHLVFSPGDADASPGNGPADYTLRS